MQLRSRPVLADPATMIDRHAEGVARQLVRGSELVERGVDRASAHIAKLRGQLEALSPLATLARGYAIVQSTDGGVIQTPTDAPDGTERILNVARGILAARSLGPGTATAASPEKQRQLHCSPPHSDRYLREPRRVEHRARRAVLPRTAIIVVRVGAEPGGVSGAA